MPPDPKRSGAPPDAETLQTFLTTVIEATAASTSSNLRTAASLDKVEAAVSKVDASVEELAKTVEALRAEIRGTQGSAKSSEAPSSLPALAPGALAPILQAFISPQVMASVVWFIVVTGLGLLGIRVVTSAPTTIHIPDPPALQQGGS